MNTTALSLPLSELSLYSKKCIKSAAMWQQMWTHIMTRDSLKKMQKDQNLGQNQTT